MIWLHFAFLDGVNLVGGVKRLHLRLRGEG